MKGIKLIIYIISPLIFSLYSVRVNLAYAKAESPHSAFSSLQETNSRNAINDSPREKYLKAEKLFKEGQQSQSLELALQVLQKAENIELKILTNKLIAQIFRSINNHRKAIVYYKNTLSLIEKKEILSDGKLSNPQLLKVVCLLDLGAEYQLIPKADSAKFYFDKILSINSFNPQIRSKKADAHINLSSLYYYDDVLKDLNKAKYHANKAIEIHKEFNDNQTLAADYGSLASIYMEEGNMQEAKKLYKLALNYIKDDNRLKAVKYREALYDNLGWTLYNLKDYVAYDYLDKSISIRDSLRDTELNKTLQEQMVKHNNEIQIRDAETKKLKAERNTWLVGLLGIITLGILFYILNFYKLRQQRLKTEYSKNQLKQQRKIDKLKSESQSKILNAAIDAKESERKQIAETLHDNVSALLSSANLHIQASQKQFNGNVPEELIKTREIIALASKQIRDLSHSLVSSVLLKFGLGYAVKDVVDKYSNSQIRFHTQLDGVRRYNQDFEIKIFNIIQEFINNILKHSNADRASIRMSERKENLEILVEDNGKGFNPKGSMASAGIGLNQIKARVKMMGGDFKIVSSENQGTKIKISVPIIEKEKVSYV